MKFDIAHLSYIGGRAINEDAYALAQGEGWQLIAVADGLGGHASGEIASRLAAGILTQHALPPFEEANVLPLFTRIHDKIVAEQPTHGKMKTTLALAAVEGSRLLMAHAGDTRIYLFRDGRIEYQSIDHSVAQIAVLAGEISPGEIRGHPDRSRVLQALGGHDTPTPVIQTYTAYPNDTLLICTDGFWEYVLEEEMLIDLCKAKSAQDFLDAMLVRLAARVRGDHDNLTAIAAFLLPGD